MNASSFSMIRRIVVLTAVLLAAASGRAAADSSGACCIDAGCQVLTEFQCQNGSGSYQGDFTLCEKESCPLYTCEASSSPECGGTCPGEMVCMGEHAPSQTSSQSLEGGCTCSTPTTTTLNLYTCGASSAPECAGTCPEEFVCVERGGISASSMANDCECQLAPVSTTSTTSTSTTLPPSNCGDGSPAGAEECDDGNLTIGDGCDAGCEIEECWECTPPSEGQSKCKTLKDTLACDDGDACTIGETCENGVCGGGASVVFGDACDWFVVGESETSSDVRLKDGAGTEITGDICLDVARIGTASVIDGDIAVTKTNGGDGVRTEPAVSITGDIVTGGAGVRGTQGDVLPHTTPPILTLAGGTTLAKDIPPGGVYDTTGNSPVLTECKEALLAVDAAKAVLDQQSVQQNNGRQRIAAGATLTLTPTVPGGINVISFERLQGGLGSTLELSGGGNAATIMIVRVDGLLSFRGQCNITLTNGLQASNVILYGRGKRVSLGSFCTTAGTIYALGKVKLYNSVTIDGQVFARRQKIKLGDKLVGTLVPNTIVLP